MKYIDQILSIIETFTERDTSEYEDDDKFADIGIDEYDMHELALMVDDYFGINLSDDDIARCVEIGDLAEIVEKEVRFKSDYE